jgi:dTMP kinase
MDDSFHQRLRDGFLDIARLAPKRCAVIDASEEANAVHNAIRSVVSERLGVTFPDDKT